MPLICNKSQRNFLEIKRKIDLAIISLKNKKIIFICEAAWLYDVPHFILVYQLNDCISCTILRANSHWLTKAEEEILV